MSSTTLYNMKMQQMVDNALLIDDLMNILRHIPLGTVKKLCSDHIERSAANENRSLYFDCCPMDHIVSPDTLQSILSFTGEQSTRATCASFASMMVRNDRNFERKRERRMDSKFDEKERQIWIVDANRVDLNAEEMRNGFQGPVSDFHEAFKAKCDIFEFWVYPGQYHLNDVDRSEPQRARLRSGLLMRRPSLNLDQKNVVIRGMGDDPRDVKIDVEALERNGRRGRLNFNNKWRISNVHLYAALMEVDRRGRLWLTDCVITYDGRDPTDCMVMSGGEFDALRVSFNTLYRSPFKFEATHSYVSTIDCRFVFDGWEHREEGYMAEIKEHAKHRAELQVISCQFWNLPECMRKSCFFTNTCQHGCSPDRLYEHDNLFLGVALCRHH